MHFHLDEEFQETKQWEETNALFTGPLDSSLRDYQKSEADELEGFQLQMVGSGSRARRVIRNLTTHGRERD
jgi:hypothetical protein